MATLDDGVTTITLNGQIIRASQNILYADRTIGGREQSYLWNNFYKYTINLLNVPSEEAAQLNEWWRDSQELTFDYDGSSLSVYIVMKDSPFISLSQPYFSEWSGNLQLAEI